MIALNILHQVVQWCVTVGNVLWWYLIRILLFQMPLWVLYYLSVTDYFLTLNLRVYSVLSLIFLVSKLLFSHLNLFVFNWHNRITTVQSIIKSCHLVILFFGHLYFYRGRRSFIPHVHLQIIWSLIIKSILQLSNLILVGTLLAILALVYRITLDLVQIKIIIFINLRIVHLGHYLAIKWLPRMMCPLFVLFGWTQICVSSMG